MPLTATAACTTFAVDDVTPDTERLPEHRTHEAVRELLGTEIESCSDYHGTVVKGVRYHALLAAVYEAFNDHRPLVLTPDAVWLTITQGVAHHMLVEGERLRNRFVAHSGRLTLEFEADGWADGSPENPWPDAFAIWAAGIRDHVGSGTHDALVCDFSTTGLVERAASQIVMMDVFDRYFHYVAIGACGIPSVTLEGMPADWERLREKAAALRVFGFDWWLDHLLPICDQFVRASHGDVDRDHWQGICKLRSRYGGDVINGWVAKLFPYLRAYFNGPCTRRNEVFETGEGFQSWVAPLGLSRVPVTWKDARTGRARRLEAVGGLVGVSQDAETGALRPKAGWAIRPAPSLDVSIGRVVAEHVTFPGVTLDERYVIPPDLSEFLLHTNGAELFGRGPDAAVRILPRERMVRMAWGDIGERFRDLTRPNGHIWFRLADLRGGGWLAINTMPWPTNDYRKLRGSETFSAVCVGSPGTEGVPGRNPVVALSFTELLKKLLDADGRPYWSEPGFTPYGDAEDFTRRR